MVVLVTGAAGFLGRRVVAALRDVGAAVVEVRRTAAAPGVAGCDLSDPEAVCALLRDVRPAAVVNLAATVDFSPGTLPALYPVNTLCPAILAAWCMRWNAYLLQASSIAVHGARTGSIGPGTPVEPAADYGTSKWLADEAIAASGCASAVIRFGGIFGREGPQHLGVNRAIEQARAGQRPAIVATGAARRNYIYVNDAAAAIRTCVERRLTGLFYAGGEVQSIGEMFQAVCDVWLPGQQPIIHPGSEAADQLIEVSSELRSTRTFRAALEDCR